MHTNGARAPFFPWRGVGCGHARHGHDFTPGIVAAEFTALEHAGNTQLGNTVRDLRRHLALEIDEIALGRLHAASNLVGRHFQERREPRNRGTVGAELIRNRPDGFDRCRHREHLAIAIADATTIGRNLDHAAVARLALGSQEIVVPALQVGRPDRQCREPRHKEQQEETRARGVRICQIRTL